MSATQVGKGRRIGERVPPAVQYETGKRYWEDLDATDLAMVACRCLRDFERHLEDGDRRKALDELQDARSLIADARTEVAGGGLR